MQQQQPPPQAHSLNSGPPPPQFPSNSITTEQIQKYLDENRNLILAIMENQNLGKLAECGQLQNVLQKNLMYLAAIADAQPPPSGPPQVAPNSVAQQGNYMQQPQGGGAMLPQQQQGGGAMLQQQPQGGSAMLQQRPQGGGAMLQQQPQGGGAMFQQQSQGSGVPKLPFQINALRPQDQQQQQLLHFQQQQQQQQQQQMHNQMGYRPGANNGMHGMHQAMQHGLGTSGGLMDIRGNKQDGPEAVTGDGQGKSASGRVGSANRES